ncbi:MAG: alanine--tRNA ligase [Candidatus Norongarragalinales archaeon]
MPLYLPGVSKERLKDEFSKNPTKYYKTKLFDEQGFVRKTCVKCGKNYWTAGGSDSCGDSSHEEYSFFKKTPLRESYAAFWKKFADFWKKNNHEVIPRYPLLAKWRDDLFFVIADVVDFQRLEGGKVVFEYPANPLVVPQPCMRFVDIANVGVTGRHFSGFMMAGQKSFNHPKDKKAYWLDDCIRLNYDFLTKVLKVPKNDLTYAEDVWSMPDFSAFGPCIESFANGSELVNSVFMQYYWDAKEGTKELPMRVVDVGWGFERLLWYYTGELTAYDAVFPSVIAYAKKHSGLRFDDALLRKYASLSAGLDVESVRNMREEKQKIASMLGLSLEEMEKQIAPMQAIYALADHSRTLLMALSDGAIPSNTGGGYNLRLLFRRCFSFVKDHNLNLSLMDLMKLHARELKQLWPEFEERLPALQEIIDVEKQKYEESLKNASNKVREIISRKEPLTSDKMMVLYESHGITPELVESVSKQQGVQLSAPTDFYKKLAEKHVLEKQAQAKKKEFDGLKPTKLVYYDKPFAYALDAKVMGSKEDKIVLDQTIFYPEGGGQCGDHGWIDGVFVRDVQKEDGVVVHCLEKHSPFAKGKGVSLKLDEKRREDIRKHHSATHVVLRAAQNVLGKHVWQAGSRKDEDEGHVNITHYKKITGEERREIERLANEVVRKGLPIKCSFQPRGEAERKYGFGIYQGGGPPSDEVRIVEIVGWDVQACGGTHCENTKDIGFIKITAIEQVQDGVLRIRYKAGDRALAYVSEHEAYLQDAADVLSVHLDELPSTVQRFFEEWKAQKKEIEDLWEKNAENYAREFSLKDKTSQELNAPQRLLEKIALKTIELNPRASVVVWNKEGFIAAASGAQSGENAVELLKAKGAKGGGDKAFARGKFS